MQLIHLHADGGPSDYSREFVDYERLKWLEENTDLGLMDRVLSMFAKSGVGGGSGTLSGYAQTHIMDHANGKTSWTMPAAVALALTTATPDSSKTGATIVEATYTGYGRQTIAGAGFNAASAGGAAAASTTSNNGAITFAACTASSSTIIGWALCDSVTTGAGNMLWWGSATSTVISTTQTPATIASGGLQESLL